MMIGKVRITSDGVKDNVRDPTLEPDARCAASVVRDQMGSLGRCRRRARNGDLCHQHAQLEDGGKFIHRTTKNKT